MAKGKMNFRFSSTLSEMKGSLLQTAVFIPDEIIESFPPGRWRCEGTLNGIQFNLAPQFKKDGARYFSVSAALRKDAKIAVGDRVQVDFRLVDPEMLVLPEAFEAVLEQDDVGKKKWDKLTVGYQRSLIHYITSVKNVDSRIKRSLEIMEKLKMNLIPGRQSSDD